MTTTDPFLAPQMPAQSPGDRWKFYAKQSEKRARKSHAALVRLRAEIDQALSTDESAARDLAAVDRPEALT